MTQTGGKVHTTLSLPPFCNSPFLTLTPTLSLPPPLPLFRRTEGVAVGSEVASHVTQNALCFRAIQQVHFCCTSIRTLTKITVVRQFCCTNKQCEKYDVYCSNLSGLQSFLLTFWYSLTSLTASYVTCSFVYFVNKMLVVPGWKQ